MIKITREAAQNLRNFIENLGHMPHAYLVKVKEYSDLLTAAIDAPEQETAAYGAQNVRNGKWGYIWHDRDDVKGWIRLQHQSDDCISYRGPVALFTATPQVPEQLLQQIAEFGEAQNAVQIPQAQDGWTVYIDRQRLQLNIGVQSFEIAVDYDEQEPGRLEWFRDKLTKAMSKLSPQVLEPSDAEIDEIFAKHHKAHETPWANYRRFARAVLAERSGS